jgi:hypothetical protein
MHVVVVEGILPEINSSETGMEKWAWPSYVEFLLVGQSSARDRLLVIINMIFRILHDSITL